MIPQNRPLDSLKTQKKRRMPRKKIMHGGPRAWGLCGLGARDPA